MRICFFFYDDNLARTCDPTWRWRDPVHVTPISPPTVSRDTYRSLSPPLSRKSRNHVSPYFVACRTPHWIHASSLPRENENVFLETGGGEKKKNTAISRGRGSTRGLEWVFKLLYPGNEQVCVHGWKEMVEKFSR